MEHKLTSLDYARLIHYVAQQFHHQMLNRTQINKILFDVYGLYLARTSSPLFDDDTPKAWPQGPVFPMVNKYIDIYEIVSFSQEKINKFVKNREAQLIVMDSVKRLHNKSAHDLTTWSCQPDTPWHLTIYPINKPGHHAQWNSEIPLPYIRSYFS